MSLYLLQVSIHDGIQGEARDCFFRLAVFLGDRIEQEEGLAPRNRSEKQKQSRFQFGERNRNKYLSIDGASILIICLNASLWKASVGVLKFRFSGLSIAPRQNSHEHKGAGRKPAPPPPPPPPYQEDEEPHKRTSEKGLKQIYIKIAPKEIQDFLLPSDQNNAGRGDNKELVRNSLTFQAANQHQFAAIWIDTVQNNIFSYIPNQVGAMHWPQDAGGVEYPCGPPEPSDGIENYLVSRIHSEGAQDEEKTKLHAEEILFHQVKTRLRAQ